MMAQSLDPCVTIYNINLVTEFGPATRHIPAQPRVLTRLQVLDEPGPLLHLSIVLTFYIILIARHLYSSIMYNNQYPPRKSV